LLKAFGKTDRSEVTKILTNFTTTILQPILQQLKIWTTFQFFKKQV